MTGEVIIMKRVVLLLIVVYIFGAGLAHAQYPSQMNHSYSFGTCTPARLNYLQNQYDKIVKELESANPYNQAYEAANPTGYSIDPNMIARMRNLDRTIRTNAALGVGGSPTNLNEYLQDRQLAYEAQIANANGMPYKDYMAMKQMNYNAMYQVRMQQLQNYQELINQCLKNMRYQQNYYNFR